MKIMKKKVLCLIVMYLIVISSLNVHAFDVTAEDLHHQTIQKLRNLNLNSMSEYAILKNIKEKPIDELQDMSSEMIEYVKSGKAEINLKNTILKKAELSHIELKRMNYTNEEIRKLKNIDKNTTLEDIETMGILATCTVYAKVLRHTFNPNFIVGGDNTGKTELIVRWGWSWDKSPAVVNSDMVVLSWNNSFQLENGYYHISNSSTVQLNRHYITHSSNYSSKKYYTSNMISENDTFNMASSTFKLVDTNVTGEDLRSDFFAKDGYGYAKLVQPQKIYSAKILFKYGHSTINATPSINFGSDISFSFNKTTTEYSSGIQNSYCE